MAVSKSGPSGRCKPPTLVEAVYREHGAQVLATLIRLVGGFDLAEDGLQEALAAASVAWSRGPPANPRAWLIRVARNKIVDQLRRRIAFRAHHDALATLADIERQAPPPDDADESVFGDDLLRLIFTCCHPALGRESQVALTLRTVCGLTTAAVAAAFLVSEETMAQRLVRAKAKIRAAAIPYRTPPLEMLDARVEGVLSVVYLVFTEAYAGDPRQSLASEAIGLARRIDHLLPGRGPVEGLLALLLLHEARRAARGDAEGGFVLLEDQDRGLWDRERITEGVALVEAALRAPGPPSSYAVQAAIAALHAIAARPEDTDWPQIVGLYEVLLRIHPSPVIELNHAAAVSMTLGPASALELIDAIEARGALAGYHLLAASRADMLRRLGRPAEALAAYRRALQLARFDPDRWLLERRMASLEYPSPLAGEGGRREAAG